MIGSYPFVLPDGSILLMVLNIDSLLASDIVLNGAIVN